MRRMILSTLLVMAMVPVWAMADEGAYPEAMASRPLVLDSGMFEAGLDVDMGMNKGRVAKDFSTDLSIAWGAFNDFEVGLVVNALNYAASGSGAKFGGFDISARYSFIDMLSAELHLYAPGDRTSIDSFGDQKVGMLLDLPFQWIAVADKLKIHAGLGLDVGFVSDTYGSSGGEFPQMKVTLDYGLTWNIIRALFVDLSFGTDLGLRPSLGSFGDRVVIPAALTLGGTMASGRLDIYAQFVLADLKPTTGKLFDMKSVGLGARMRF